MKKLKQTLAVNDPKTLRQALSVSDPSSVIIRRSTRNKRMWCAWSVGGEWLTTSPTKKEATRWGIWAQAGLTRKLQSEIRAYCGRTGARL